MVSFPGSDPATDFRGTGILSLMQLYTTVKNLPESKLAAIVQLSRNEPNVSAVIVIYPSSMHNRISSGFPSCCSGNKHYITFGKQTTEWRPPRVGVSTILEAYGLPCSVRTGINNN